MSSFMKKGKRLSVNKENKKRMELVIDILEELDRIAVQLIKWSADNKTPIDKSKIKELAKEHSDLPIDKIEEGIIWSKIQDFGRRLEEHREKNNS